MSCGTKQCHSPIQGCPTAFTQSGQKVVSKDTKRFQELEKIYTSVKQNMKIGDIKSVQDDIEQLMKKFMMLEKKAAGEVTLSSKPPIAVLTRRISSATRSAGSNIFHRTGFTGAFRGIK